MTSPDARIQWSRDFVVLRTDAPLADLLPLLAGDGPYYIVLERMPDLLYVFPAEELAHLPRVRRYRQAAPPATVLVLDIFDEMHEDDSSNPARADGTPLPHPYAEPMNRRPKSSRERFVAFGSDGAPVAVGEDIANLTLGGGRHPLPVALHQADSRKRAMRPPAATGATTPPADDSTPTRYPSITADRILAPGDPVVVTVDLLRERTDLQTASAGVVIADLPSDWTEIEVVAELVSSAIDFDHPTAFIHVRRDAASAPATFEGTVRATLVAGQAAKIVALFSYRGRDCGMATRVFTVGQQTAKPAATEASPLVIETDVVAPALTVRILRPDASMPGRLSWSLSVPRADVVPGLPGRLSGLTSDLGKDQDKYVAELYRGFAAVTPGTHEDLFRGVGDELWDRTPEPFRRTYWALRAALGPGFPIQLITDEPRVPWELMRPTNDATGETGGLLALEHPIGRWIADYEGSLHQRLGTGRVVTIAPHYKMAKDDLPRAREESDLLSDKYAARRVPGTLADVKALLHDGVPGEHVAVVHFAGHGEVSADNPSFSSIKLEDGSLQAAVVGAREVKLGERDGPLVVFNACKVGATGESLGATGGWAEVFLRRQFRGVIAPLWAVYDEDAPIVVEELFAAIVGRRERVGQALRQIRKDHAATSPTFLAYLYYGDVMARLPAPGT